MFTPVNIDGACLARLKVRDVYRGKHESVALHGEEFENGWFEGWREVRSGEWLPVPVVEKN